MKKGDVVELLKHSHWGGCSPTGKFGILIKRTYLAYDSELSRWQVCVDGTVVTLQENQMRKAYREAG